MAILHNGNEYSSTKIINYSAAPDYNRGVTVDNIQSGNYQATDNGFLMIQLQSQQSNPTKVSVVRSKTPITNTGTEIASIVLSQYQYSETLTAQVMARDYYKLVIEGVGNPQVISCMFYPYASNVPMKLTENISVEQVEGLENELAGKQDKGNYFNKDTDILGTNNGGTGTEDGYLFANVMTFTELRKRFTALGSTAVATEQFVNAIDDSAKTAFKVNLVSAKSYISDCPLSNAILEVVRLTDNTVILTVKDLFVLTTYEFRKTPDGQFSGWKKTTNADGSIPDDLIPDIDLSTKTKGILPYTKGGTNRNDGLARGIKNGVLRTENTWQTDNTQGTDVMYWQTADFASKGLPYTAGALISNVFTSTLKSFMALDLSSTHPRLSLRVNNTGEWKRLAFVDEIPTVLKYENSDGVWTETKLTTGEVMLGGYITNDSDNIISLPKTVNVNNTYVRISYDGGTFGMSGGYPSYTIESNRILINTYDISVGKLDISIVAFLA